MSEWICPQVVLREGVSLGLWFRRQLLPAVFGLPNVSFVYFPAGLSCLPSSFCQLGKEKQRMWKPAEFWSLTCEPKQLSLYQTISTRLTGAGLGLGLGVGWGWMAPSVLQFFSIAHLSRQAIVRNRKRRRTQYGHSRKRGRERSNCPPPPICVQQTAWGLGLSRSQEPSWGVSLFCVVPCKR